MAKKRVAIKDYLKESSLFNRRLFLSFILIIGLLTLLIFRLYYLQIEQHDIYKALSEKNQVTLIPIDPNRGLIYDRNGVLIAQNIPVFSLEIIPDKVTNLKQTIEKLSKIIKITDEDKESFFKQLKQHRRFDTIPLKVKLADDEVSQFYVNQFLFPGVLIRANLMRYYPLGGSLVNIVGYVGRINEQELNQIDQTNYAATNFIGKVGIEKYYENKLHGQVGYQQVETDASGRIVRILRRIPPVPGDTLYLSIDTKLQLAAEQALGEDFGAVIVIQPKTGEVLAMASNPNYDPNVFVKGIKKQAYIDLQNAPGKPLYNRTIRGQYPFGSTIKPFLALQALNTNTITPSFKIIDHGLFSLPHSAHVYRDWKKGGHGTVDVVRAITISCDIFFFTVGMKMGISNIDAILNEFGFGKLTGIDLNEELPGLVPSPAWKRKAKGEAWYQGDTVISSIGQGFMLTTPLQLANGAAIMSMRGAGFRPHLLIKSVDSQRNISLVKPVPYPPIKAKTENWDLVLKGMRQVVLPGGTAALFGPTPYLVAGKTGTAQVYSTFGKEISKATINSLPKNLRDNTLFIAFAPVDKPEIAVAVILEHSHEAKMVARKVFDAYFQREKPNETPQQQPTTQH